MLNPTIVAAAGARPADTARVEDRADDATADRLARSVCAWAIVGDLAADNLLDTARPDAAILAAGRIERALTEYLADPFAVLASAGHAVVQLPKPDFADDGIDYWLDGDLAVDCTSSRIGPEIRHQGGTVSTAQARRIGLAWLATAVVAGTSDRG
jgi:hypothetical protein